MRIYQLSPLRKIYLLLVAGGAALVMLAFMFSGSLAQAPDADSNALFQDSTDPCQPYYVTVDSSNIRACASLGCRVVDQAQRDDLLCIRGEAPDSDQWLQVDMDPADPRSPIYFISAQVVAPGASEASGATANTPDCQPWLVDASSTTVYECAEPGCASLGALEQETWLCGYYYETVPDWVYAQYSDTDLAGWVARDDLAPTGGNTGQPIPLPQATATPALGAGETDTATASETLQPSVTPGEGPLTFAGEQLPACQHYFVSASQALVRSCAGANCAVVDALTLGDGVCIRGVTDNPEWLILSLTSEDTVPALYAIEKEKITPGHPPEDTIALAFADCFEFWRADVTENVNVRQCPSLTCPVLGTISPDEWVCVQDYGGQYEDWLRVDIPGGLAGAWISDAVMIPYEGEGSPLLAMAQATGTPSVAETTAEEAACVPYIVDVVGASGGNVRLCPSTDCDVVDTYPQGSTLCVLGLDPEDQNWLIVDRNPNDSGDELVYINQEVVRAEGEPASVTGVTAGTTAQVVLPTNTPVPSQPICEPGSTLENCVTATPTAAPVLVAENVPTGPLLAQEVALSNINVSNIEMVSPIGSALFRVTVPENWVMAGNNVLYLNLEYFETKNTADVEFITQEMITLLDVYVDDQLAATVSLTEENIGVQTLAIPLPLNLIGDPEFRTHLIRLEMRAEDHCLLNSESQVFIRSDQSYFHFEFRESLPVLDLALYPRPFYNQQFTADSEVLYIVLPPVPTENDIQVATAIAAGLGSLTFNDLELRVLTSDKLDATTRGAHNLMLIGQVDDHPLIQQYYEQGLFPSELSSDGSLSVAGETVAPTDGLMQVIANPDNDLLATMAVTGQTAEALTKAGQALAGPPSLMGVGGDVSIITSARPVLRPPMGLTLESQLTFAQLGYEYLNLGGFGSSSDEIRFYMPANFRLTDDAYVDLQFYYSSVLNGSRTTLTLVLNGEYPIASTYLDQPARTTSNGDGEIVAVEGGPYHLRAHIPPEAVIPGEQNSLAIIVTVRGDWDCYPPDSSVAWFTVSGDSLLNLPRERVNPMDVAPIVGWFPVPFNTQPDLRDVWFSLSENATIEEIGQAIQMAARLGEEVDAGEGFSPRVSLGDFPDGVNLADYNFIVFGRHTTNPFLTSLNDSLPQPFTPGTDDLQQLLDDVTFRLPSGYEIGVLQILLSPWNSDRVILVVSGTGPSGQGNAASALSEFLYGRSELMGDVVYVSQYNVSAIDTRFLDDAEEIATAVAESYLEATQTAEVVEAIQATATASTATPTPEPSLIVSTVTPQPTLSPTYTLTVGPTYTASPIFTLTPEPTLPTPIPTFEPLSQQELEPESTEPPDWFGGLVLVTGILVLATVVFGLLRLARGNRRR